MMHILTETEAAYIAGIIDGEGSIVIGIRSPKPESREVSFQYVPSVSVEMCNEEIILWLYNKTGIGKVYYHESKNKDHKSSVRWALGLYDGCELLERITPYLIVKSLQAFLFIEFARIRSKSTGKKRNDPESQLAIVTDIKALNRRGR